MLTISAAQKLVRLLKSIVKRGMAFLSEIRSMVRKFPEQTTRRLLKLGPTLDSREALSKGTRSDSSYLRPDRSFVMRLALHLGVLARDSSSVPMRYLVKARVKPGREAALARAIHDKTLGQSSIAGDEYLRDMEKARVDANRTVTWVEVCFCQKPLAEERPYWERYFELLAVNFGSRN